MQQKSILGPMMVDVEGFSLTNEEKKRLSRPEIGGVILFRRNYQSLSQLKQLILEIKEIKFPELVIAVDHEGGRVQRFIEGFTRIPAMRTLGEIWEEQDKETVARYAHLTGWVLAEELRAVGIDFSFAPVLDLDWGRSLVIGNRSFHSKPEVVIELVNFFITGLKRGGMQGCCGKHFPGHGYTREDSHITLPKDDRSLEILRKTDLLVFSEMIKKGISAIMPAHVLYSAVDNCYPAGCSSFWLKEILRKQLGFEGLIISDSLTMEGVKGFGNIVECITLVQNAGCDIFLICNRPDLVDLVLNNSNTIQFSDYTEKWEKMRGKGTLLSHEACLRTEEFKTAQKIVSELYLESDVDSNIGEKD